jgi:hypothetical protein
VPAPVAPDVSRDVEETDPARHHKPPPARQRRPSAPSSNGVARRHAAKSGDGPDAGLSMCDAEPDTRTSVPNRQLRRCFGEHARSIPRARKALRQKTAPRPGNAVPLMFTHGICTLHSSSRERREPPPSCVIRLYATICAACTAADCDLCMTVTCPA